MNFDYKVFGLYFPQFYSIPENDEWWGEGFNDWELVKDATPITKDQVQPRIPSELGYYDQSSPEVISRQAALAKNYGLAGFGFYHYWFDGKVLLDKPMLNLLTNPDIDIEYFFTWANETWTRQWVGKPNDILIKQSHIPDPDIWSKHYAYLKPFFNDKRYLKVKNKPVFCIYRPELINNLKEFMLFFNQKAKEDGFDGLYFIAFRSYEILDAQKIYSGFDALVNFQPRYIFNKYFKNKNKLIGFFEKLARQFPEKIQLFIVSLIKNNSNTIYDYNKFIDLLGEDLDFNGLPVYQSICPDWDNTARYKERATFFKNVSVHDFENGLIQLKKNVDKNKEKLIIINAWNEWSESAYLEPDKETSYKLLDTVKKVFPN